MNNPNRIFAACVLSTIAGCAAGRSATNLAPATAPSGKALLSLEQIEPKPVLQTPTTRNSGPAPVEALSLYAEAHIAELKSDRINAAKLLSEAAAKDPDSFQIRYELGMLYAAAGTNERTIDTLEQAAKIDPDHVNLQLQLGRQYLSRQVPDVEKAIDHLRLALQTKDYKWEPGDAAMVNLLLARGLQQKGYDTAALSQYELVLQRLQHVGMAARGSHELYFLSEHLEQLYAQVGELQERLGKTDLALSNFTEAGRRAPGNFDFQSRVVHLLLASKKNDEARQLVASLVSRFHASPESINLLREAYQRLDVENELIPDLQKALKAQPTDRSMQLAVADLLWSEGRFSEAQDMLLGLIRKGSDDPKMLRRLFGMYGQRHETAKGAALLIEATALYPQLLREAESLWPRLTEPGAINRLQQSSLDKIEVPDSARGAKLYWLSYNARLWGRDGAAQPLLNKAVEQRPIFSPAWRELLARNLARPDWDAERKAQETQKQIGAAKAAGNLTLVEDMRGLLLLSQKKPAEAEVAFRAGQQLGDRLPQDQLSLAFALSEQKKDKRYEQLLWKIVSDFPTFDDAYIALFRHYISDNSAQQAIHVLQVWRQADPDSVDARLMESSVYLQIDQVPEAKKIVVALFKEQPQNPEVVAGVEAAFAKTSDDHGLVALFEQEREKHPYNRAVVERLVDIDVGQKHFAEATRTIDAMRASVATDPDLLYHTAHLYDRVDQTAMTEKTLQDILKLEPAHPGACNDLGYMWADAGKNLPEAEALIRKANEAEPDNAAFLDSLGWVCYKRAQFADAEKYLQQAVAHTPRPDPTVLDHLGDAQYRLHHTEDAAKNWKQSLDRLGATEDVREESRQLKLQLMDKIKQLDQGNPVKVAPVAKTSTQPTEADPAAQ